MVDEELKQRVIDEILSLAGIAEIPPNAITSRDLMRGTKDRPGMSESQAWRTLRKLHAEGKLERARGHNGGYYYWPVEEKAQ